MTRKDYVLIAQAIKDEVEYIRAMGELSHQAELIARGVASALAADNPRFDRERFMRACGFDGE